MARYKLRHDPMMAVLAGKLEARRADCAPVAGKSTLNRLELSELAPTRYHKISHNPIAIRTLLVDLFLEAHARPPRQIILDLDATDDPLHGEQEGRFFHGYYDCYCYLPLYAFCGRHLLVAKRYTEMVEERAVNRSFFLCLAVCRMRTSAWDTLSRSFAPPAPLRIAPLCSQASSLLRPSSDFSCPFVGGYGSSPSRRGLRWFPIASQT